MFNKLTIEDYDLKGKKVLLRVDFNVPLNEQGKITSDKRIVASLPTIKKLQEKGAKIVICSHDRLKNEFSCLKIWKLDNNNKLIMEKNFYFNIKILLLKSVFNLRK